MKRKLAIFALLTLVAPGATSAAVTEATQISVTGTATIAAVPDQATVNASIVTTTDSAVASSDQNNRRYQAIVDALTRLGIARDDITLSYYNVNYVPKPTNGAAPQPYDRYGYTVDRSFDVKVRQVSKAGAVVDALTSAGVTNVGGVSFGVADSRGLQAQAMQRAIGDARSQADALAKAAGLHVTRIVSISTEGRAPIVPMVKAMAAVQAAAPTTFDQGNVNVTSNVSVIFAASP